MEREPRDFRPGDIITVTLAGNLGVEIGDNEDAGYRSVVVMRPCSLDQAGRIMTVAVPLRDAEKYVASMVKSKLGTMAESDPYVRPGDVYLPADAGGLSKDSIALVAQIRALDVTKRFRGYHGRLHEDWVTVIRQEITTFFGIPMPRRTPPPPKGSQQR